MVTVTIFAILLAAGFSSRFAGQNKLLAAFRGKPLARHTLDLVCAMNRFEKIFFVYAHEEVAALAAGLPVTPVKNPSPEKGQGESARLGVAAAAVETAGDEEVYYLFLPCDQPLLDAETLHLLLDAARPGCIVEPFHHSLVCPGILVCPGSPSLFSASFRDELLALGPGEYPRLLKSRHRDAVIQVEVPNPAALKDIDTRADLQRIIEP